MSYDVRLDAFEGPLDLLLHLIRKNDMEITEIPISQITHEYLGYLDLMKELNLEIAGDFLVMASTLIEIKMKMLLPRHDAESSEEDPRTELINRLLEYQRYKDASKKLLEGAVQAKDVFYRGAPVFAEDDFRLDAGLFDLLASFQKLLKEAKTEVREILHEEIPLEDKIRQVLTWLEQKEFMTFEELFQKETRRMGLIVTFLAVLELIRTKQIQVRQAVPFGEIRVYRLITMETANGEAVHVAATEEHS